MNVLWTLTKAVIFGTGAYVWGMVIRDAIKSSDDGPFVRPVMVSR